MWHGQIWAVTIAVILLLQIVSFGVSSNSFIPQADEEKSIASIPFIQPASALQSSTPTGYIEQESYSGDCELRPSGTTCLAYSDGYHWLVSDGVRSWEDVQEDGKNVGVAVGDYAKYYHIAHTNFVKMGPLTSQPPSPIHRMTSVTETESGIITAYEICEMLLSQDELKRISGYTDRLLVSSQVLDPTTPITPFESGCMLLLYTLDRSSMIIMRAVTHLTDDQAENEWNSARASQENLYDIEYTREGEFSGGWKYRSIKINDNEFAYFWISHKDVYFLSFTNKITGGHEPVPNYSQLEDLAKLVQNKIDDKRPPTVVVPPDIVVDATGPEGTFVIFSVTASDEAYGVLIPTCTPSSVSLFSVGVTTVICSATDGSGNTHERTFSVTVKPFVGPGTIAVDLDGTSVDVSYDVDGVEVVSVQSDSEFISLFLQVEVTGSPGILEITLDRNFLDATLDSLDNEFLIITDGFNEPTFEEVETTSELRTLRIELASGTEELEIFGTAFGEPEPVKEMVPGWIKNNAKWWSDGQIGDTDFLSGIQFMIKEKIINIPYLPEQASETAEEKVPPWIRLNAGWWADGQISEDEFVNGIKWLVENGIIKV